MSAIDNYTDNGLMFGLLSLGCGDDEAKPHLFDGNYPSDYAIKLSADRAALMGMLKRVGPNFAETLQHRNTYDNIASHMFTTYKEYAESNWTGPEGAQKLDASILYHVEFVKAKMPEFQNTHI